MFPESRVRGGGAIHGDPERGRWVHFGDDEHYIALQENLPHTARQDVTYANDGINHLGFVVEGLDDIQARLKCPSGNFRHPAGWSRPLIAAPTVLARQSSRATKPS